MNNQKPFIKFPSEDSLDYNYITSNISNAFSRLKTFMNGESSAYYSFDFFGAFSVLFRDTRKGDDFTYENCKRINEYWKLIDQITLDYENSNIKNLKAKEDKGFCYDCNELVSMLFILYKEFDEFSISEELEKHKNKNPDSNNPKPTLFSNSEVYKCFKEYTKNHIIDYINDYSYLKKRLDHEKLIYYHKDNDFMKIIFKDLKLISRSKYDDYSIKNKLNSLNKSSSAQRENNFNKVFDKILNTS